MGIYRFGTTNIPLAYTQQELTQKVIKLVDEMPAMFTFQNLCSRILDIAEEEGKLKKEHNTEYSTIHLTINDIQSISRVLWNMIWERKVYLVFEAYPTSRESKEMIFAKY